MIYKYTFTKRAAAQYREAVLWYVEKSILAGRNFDIELDEKIREICLHPTLYRNNVKKFRETNLKYFPFTIVYKIDEKKSFSYYHFYISQQKKPKRKIYCIKQIHYMSRKINSRRNLNIMNKWEDESFVAEMENEYNSYLNGGKVFSAEELEKELDEVKNRLHGKKNL